MAGLALLQPQPDKIYMHLTSFTDYSLRTLLYLAAHPGESFSIKDIAEYYGVSRNHLVKVAHKLGQLGYIETSRGKGGGIKIAPHAGQTRLGDLVVELEPHMNMVECFDPATNTCKIASGCHFKGILAKATKSYLTTLNQYTLSKAALTKSYFDETQKIVPIRN